MTDLSQSNSVADEVARLVEEQATLTDWVLERLDDLKGDLQAIFDGIDPPHQPPRGFDLPIGCESSLEAIAQAIFTAERRWSR